MLRNVPLIVILGSTGTGKTKLSLELAEWLGGAEIVSADSMQVYANLDIVTAKATKEEQKLIKHHLLDVANPLEPYTVRHFRDAALPIIDNLLSRSQYPIVVGGTNYYIESLLWNILLDLPLQLDLEVKLQSSTNHNPQNERLNRLLSGSDDWTEFSSEYLHGLLKEVDLDSANRFHPRNKRKIIRALQVYQLSGQTMTEQLKQQRQQGGGNRLGGPLRYPHTLMFWLCCNQDVLNKRLDKRIDGMLEQGLIRELRNFHNEYKEYFEQAQVEDPYTKGILQTIGYKEFMPYLKEFDEANDLKIEEYLQNNLYKVPRKEDFGKHFETHDLPPGLDLLSKCLDELKLVTRRYSKKQQKWIRNRFLGSQDRQVPPMYELDTSNVNAWNENVLSRARIVIDSYVNGRACEIRPMEKIEHPGVGLNEEVSNYCQLCQRHFIGEYQWHLHLKSNKHKKARASKRKMEPKSE